MPRAGSRVSVSVGVVPNSASLPLWPTMPGGGVSESLREPSLRPSDRGQRVVSPFPLLPSAPLSARCPEKEESPWVGVGVGPVFPWLYGLEGSVVAQ